MIIKFGSKTVYIEHILFEIVFSSKWPNWLWPWGLTDFVIYFALHFISFHFKSLSWNVTERQRYICVYMYVRTVHTYVPLSMHDSNLKFSQGFGLSQYTCCHWMWLDLPQHSCQKYLSAFQPVLPKTTQIAPSWSRVQKYLQVTFDLFALWQLPTNRN